MFLPMLEACPRLSTVWEQFASDYPEDPEYRPYYIFISDVVRECIRLSTDGGEDDVKNILAVVERWLIEGDLYVKEAATVGFLEDLMNTNLHSDTTPEDFVPLLGPESRYWWKKVEQFWSEGTPIVDSR